MLETLRAYGAGLLAEAGEQDEAAAALARYAVRVAEQAAAGLQTNTAGEPAAARWLDAEDATMRQVLAWAMDHDPDIAARLAAALGWWWMLRGPAGRPVRRCCASWPGAPRRAARGGAPRSSGSAMARWTRRTWPSRWMRYRAAWMRSGPGAVPGAGGRTGGRAVALANLGRVAEAVGEARRALAVAREIGYPAAET